MRKIYLLFSALLTAHFSLAQVKVYPKVGMVHSTQKLDLVKDADKQHKQTQSITGYQAGVGLSKGITEQVDLTVSLDYTELGYEDNLNSPATNSKDSYKTKYLVLPVGLNYKLLSGKSARLYVSGGGYGGLFLKGKHTYTEDLTEWHYHYYPGLTNGESYIKANDEYNYARFDWGVQFGSSLSVDVGRKTFVLDAKYAMGMADAREITADQFHNNTYREVGTKGKNRFFGLSLGYVLPL